MISNVKVGRLPVAMELLVKRAPQRGHISLLHLPSRQSIITDLPSETAPANDECRARLDLATGTSE